MNKVYAAICASALAISTPVWADSWTLDGGASQLAFGSVKNGYNGEVHTFGGLSGSVGADGAAMIEIDLGSVQTNIDIRNERMAEHVFKLAPKAMLMAQLDMGAMDAMGVGETASMEIDGTLELLGEKLDLPVQVFVARLGEDKVLVTSDMVYVATDEIGVDEGIDKLQELASLDSITRAVPVTLRLVFSADGQGS